MSTRGVNHRTFTRACYRGFHDWRERRLGPVNFNGVEAWPSWFIGEHVIMFVQRAGVKPNGDVWYFNPFLGRDGV